MKFRIVLAFILVFAVSCTKEKPVEPPAVEHQAPATTDPQQGAAAQGSGTRTITISPATAYSKSIFTLKASGFELLALEGENRIVWTINGSPVSTVDPVSLDLGGFIVDRGDTVQAVAYLDGEAIYSNPVTVLNNPPKITSYEFYDNPGATSSNISIEVVAEDPDGDAVTLEYQWTVNGVLAGNSKSPALSPSLDDDIEVTVRAFDGQDYSAEIKDKFTLLNRAPRIERIDKYFIVGSTYIYNASASDPDMEPVTFSLVKEPDGMIIDPQSGQVRWEIPTGFLGTIEYTVVVTDAKGANGILPMKFSVYRE